METTDGVLWPLASSPERARWAAQAVERYLHMAQIIMSRAAAWPGPEATFLPQVLGLAQQLYAAIARLVNAPGSPRRPDVPCTQHRAMAQGSEEQRCGRG